MHVQQGVVILHCLNDNLHGREVYYNEALHNLLWSYHISTL